MSDRDKITWDRGQDGRWRPMGGGAVISAPPPPRRWRVPARGPVVAAGVADTLPDAIAAASDALRALRGEE